jgi:outer membrane protein OmpA-like peptidoglycan-associated protein
MNRTQSSTIRPLSRPVTRLLALSTVAAAAMLAACSTTPTTTPELTLARDSVQRASADSNVLNYGALELKKATDALNRANTLSVEGESATDVNSTAYVAKRYAEAAMAIADSKANEEAIKASQIERERIRANVSMDAADRARAEAVTARVDAATAQQQADLSRAQARIARSDAAQASQQAAAAQAQAQALEAQLDDLRTQQTDRGMLVTLGDVLFEFGSADIKPSAQSSLNKLAMWLKAHPERRVLVEGFTDTVGSESANLQLSKRRADAVMAALAAQGISADRLDSEGYGESYPVADNRSDSNRALNRRVEVYISNNDQPVRSRG